jgi:hypothetical protein
MCRICRDHRSEGMLGRADNVFVLASESRKQTGRRARLCSASRGKCGAARLNGNVAASAVSVPPD